jgi:ribosomal protein S4
MERVKKVKKKWITWRLYKRFFLWKKKIDFFTKFKLFFTYSKVINKYLIKAYGFKKSKQLKSDCKKYLKITNNKIYNFLYKLEFRLDLILTRIYFVRNIKQCQQLISNNRLIINNKILKNKKYILYLNDVIYFNIHNFIDKKKIIALWKNKKKFRYKFLFKYKIKNYLEINYKIGMFIYIKWHWSNELLKKKKIKTLNFSLFKKYWGFT